MITRKQSAYFATYFSRGFFYQLSIIYTNVLWYLYLEDAGRRCHRRHCRRFLGRIHLVHEISVEL